MSAFNAGAVPYRTVHNRDCSCTGIKPTLICFVSPMEAKAITIISLCRGQSFARGFRGKKFSNVNGAFTSLKLFNYRHQVGSNFKRLNEIVESNFDVEKKPRIESVSNRLSLGYGSPSKVRLPIEIIVS